MLEVNTMNGSRVTAKTAGMESTANITSLLSPIVGTTKPHHLDDALAAMEVNLTEDEVKLLEEPYRPHPVIAHS